MLASSVQAVVACYATVPRACTKVLFIISVNYCLFSWPENEASLNARLVTNVNIKGGRGYRPGSRPFYTAIETQRLQTLSSVYLFE